MIIEIDSQFLKNSADLLIAVGGKNDLKNSKLQSIIFDITEKEVFLFASDGNISFSIETKICENKEKESDCFVKRIEPGIDSFSADLKKFKDIISNCEEDTIWVKSTPGETSVEIVVDNVSHFILRENIEKQSTTYTDRSDIAATFSVFLEQEENEKNLFSIKIPGTSLLSGIREGSACCDEDDPRWGHSCLLIKSSDSKEKHATFASSSRNVSIFCEYPYEGDIDKFYLMIPNKSFKSMLKFKLLEDLDLTPVISFSERKFVLTFSYNSTVYKMVSPLMSSKLQSAVGSTKVIPKEKTIDCLFNRRELLKSLLKINIANSKFTHNLCEMSISSGITELSSGISNNSADCVGEQILLSRATIKSTNIYVAEGTTFPVRIKFNIKFLIDLARTSPEENIPLRILDSESTVVSKYSDNGYYFFAPASI